MKIRQISALLDATVLAGAAHVEDEVLAACGSDMMSDVLAFVNDQAVLLTGLVNQQVIRTAMMMDMRCVVFLRNKRPTAEMLALAEENGMAVLLSSLGMYDACGLLYCNGLGRDGGGQ